MTKREAAIVSAYTGILVGSFDDMQRYVDEKLGEPTWTHQYGNKAFAEQVKELSRTDFMELVIDQ